MSTETTAEKVAEFLTDADNDFHEGLEAWPSIRANGNVVEIRITPMDEDGDEDKANAADFRAHVFQVEPEPPIAAEGVDLEVELARELAYSSVGVTFRGWTVVEREDAGSGRWESYHQLVIRNETGEHFDATYSKGLTEYQDTRPWEDEKTARFEPVARQTIVTQVHAWVAPAAQGEAKTAGGVA